MYNKINEDLLVSMKNKNTFELSVLRMLKSALQLEKIAKKEDLNDKEVINVLKKQVKIRKDSVQEYKKYNKNDVVETLEKEIAVIEKYLPQELGEDELKKIIETAFQDVNPQSMKDMGLIMKNINEKLENKNADMSLVSKLVKERLMTK